MGTRGGVYTIKDEVRKVEGGSKGELTAERGTD